MSLLAQRGQHAVLMRYMRCGFLFSVESLLSTRVRPCMLAARCAVVTRARGRQGKELGMLEDAAAGFMAMFSVAFRVLLAPPRAGSAHEVSLQRCALPASAPALRRPGEH